KEKVVPLDGGADRARDDGAAQLAAMHIFGQRARRNVGHGHSAASPVWALCPPAFPARRHWQIFAAWPALARKAPGTARVSVARKLISGGVMLLSRLARGRTHTLQAVGIGRRNGGAHDQPRLIGRPRPAAMERRAIVPHHHVAPPPGVRVTQARLARRTATLCSQLLLHSL